MSHKRHKISKSLQTKDWSIALRCVHWIEIQAGTRGHTKELNQSKDPWMEDKNINRRLLSWDQMAQRLDQGFSSKSINLSCSKRLRILKTYHRIQVSDTHLRLDLLTLAKEVIQSKYINQIFVPVYYYQKISYAQIMNMNYLNIVNHSIINQWLCSQRKECWITLTQTWLPMGQEMKNQSMLH